MAEDNDFGMKGLYAFDTVNIGLESMAVKCFRAVSSSSRVGRLPKSTSSFGRVVFIPKRSCDGEDSVVRVGVFRQPSNTYGKAFVQEDSMERIRKDCFKVRWNLSSNPLVCGW